MDVKNKERLDIIRHLYEESSLSRFHCSPVLSLCENVDGSLNLENEEWRICSCDLRLPEKPSSAIIFKSIPNIEEK